MTTWLRTLAFMQVVLSLCVLKDVAYHSRNIRVVCHPAEKRHFNLITGFKQPHKQNTEYALLFKV